MSFTEKSAWVMSLALLLGGLMYFGMVIKTSLALEVLASPALPSLVAYTVVLVIIAILGHVIAALHAPGEVSHSLDERERLIASRASGLAHVLLGVGTLLSLILYLVTRNGDLLFYTVFGSLMLGQLAEYVGQIGMHRMAL